MKRRIVKKQMRRILNSDLPVMFKLSAMNRLVKSSPKSSLFQLNDCPNVKFERFSTSLHKGYVTVSEHNRIDEIGFSTWHSATTWVFNQVKNISNGKIQCSEYVIDSGHYRYRVYF